MERAKRLEIQDVLIKENQDFKQLVDQHEGYEKRLSELADIHFPNDDEVLEETKLKKEKLAVKDKIYEMMNAYAGV